MLLPFLPQVQLLSAIGCRPTIEGKEILPNNYIFDSDALERLSYSMLEESDDEMKETPQQTKARAEKLKKLLGHNLMMLF